MKTCNMREIEIEYIQTLHPEAREEDFTLLTEQQGVEIYTHPTLGRVAVGPDVGDAGPATFDEDRISALLSDE